MDNAHASRVHDAVHPTVMDRPDVVRPSDRLGATTMWQSSPERFRVPATDDYAIATNFDGSSSVTRYERNRIVGAAPGRWTLTTFGGETPSDWHMPDPIRVLHIYLDRARLRNFVVEHFDIDGDDLLLEQLWGIADPLMEGIFRGLVAELDGRHEISRLLLDQFETLISTHMVLRHSNLVERCSARRSKRSSGAEDARVSRACDYVKAHLDQALSLDDLAGIACLSRFHFGRVFKRDTGLSPYQYVMRTRIDRAKELLKSSELGVTQIAHACGFASQSHLSDTFRRMVGASPVEWRQTMRS